MKSSCGIKGATAGFGIDADSMQQEPLPATAETARGRYRRKPGCNRREATGERLPPSRMKVC